MTTSAGRDDRTLTMRKPGRSPEPVGRPAGRDRAQLFGRQTWRRAGTAAAIGEICDALAVARDLLCFGREHLADDVDFPAVRGNRARTDSARVQDSC